MPILAPLLLLLAAPLLADEPEPMAWFLFRNPDSSLAVAEEVPEPLAETGGAVLCSDGGAGMAKFQRIKDAPKEELGREYGFASIAGQVFALSWTRKPRDTAEFGGHKACLLMPRALADGVEAVPVAQIEHELPDEGPPPNDALSAPLRAKIENLKGRKLTRFWKLADIGKGGKGEASVWLLQFERKGDELLAAVALLPDLSFDEQPATCGEDGCAWRAGGEGERSPDMSISLALKSKKGGVQAFAYSWRAEEGESNVLLWRRGGELKNAGSKYLYQAPR